MFRTAWGIAVDLTAEATFTTSPPAPSPSGSGPPVSPHVRLDASPALTHPPTDRSGWRITPEEAAWLRHGVALAAPAIEARHAPRHTTITVHRVLFPHTDYQPEGLAAAMLAWTEAEFALPPHPVDARFDPVTNRYVYSW
ncbi:hypothetical protein [Streptomyces sp. KL118A]|uniref:hypothetical protein n=1 Tax=Streptomyces sp. KL118A TaxID=3045153 RepID=UPI00278C1E55|nr:hypothetical protein [Streptomyces sp. KL118A]